MARAPVQHPTLSSMPRVFPQALYEAPVRKQLAAWGPLHGLGPRPW